MHRTGHSVACDRVRAQISLELDGEISQLERALVSAHLRRCADCHAFRERVRGFTTEFRAAPLVRPPADLHVRRPRRISVVARYQAGVAAAMALAIVGVAAEIAAPQRGDTQFRSIRVVHYQSQNELEHELTLLGVSADGLYSGPSKLTAR
jgi:predicted anti-sigma-YlaC factor YlaD